MCLLWEGTHMAVVSAFSGLGSCEAKSELTIPVPRSRWRWSQVITGDHRWSPLQHSPLHRGMDWESWAVGFVLVKPLDCWFLVCQQKSSLVYFLEAGCQTIAVTPALSSRSQVPRMRGKHGSSSHHCLLLLQLSCDREAGPWRWGKVTQLHLAVIQKCVFCSTSANSIFISPSCSQC